MAPFAENRLTHCIDRYTTMKNSPYKLPGATFGWIAASFRAIDHCRSPEALSKLKVPTLILGGTNETVVDAAAFRLFVDLATQHAQVSVKLQLIQQGRHELFSEIPRIYNPTLEHVRFFLRDFLA